MSSSGSAKEKIIVTSALPYANGPIHFGHIAGAYLPADIFVRYKKMNGADIIYVCGTDDHGVAITISAEAAGRSPEEHVKINHDLIVSIFERMNIDFTNFSGTSRKLHYPISQEFFTRLLENGMIDKKEGEQLYCPKHEKYLADRYVRGECPHCGFPDAWGNECGKCGVMLETHELKNPRCNIKDCGTAAESRKTTHWYLNLGSRAEWLEEWLSRKESGEAGLKWKQLVTTEVRGYLKRGLESRAITRDLDWGVPVPLDEADGKVLYVWFDAPIGYISSTVEYFQSIGESPDRWRDYWQNPDCKLYHFIGKDNIPFHAIIFPIMLERMRQGYKIPDFVASNAFLNLEGRQFSKSAGWYIDVIEFMEKYPTDSIRYYLCADMPENSDSEFQWDRYMAAHNSELTNIYANLVNRTLKFVASKMDGRVPPLGDSGASVDAEIVAAIEAAPGAVGGFIERFEFRNALAAMLDLARAGNKYFDAKEPWKALASNRADADATIRLCLKLIKTMAVISSPFVPDTAQKIWSMLGLEGRARDVRWDEASKDTLADGAALPEPEILFTRIEKAQIEEEKKKLEAIASKSGKDRKKKSASIPGVKKNVVFDDFAKLDLRVARVVEAERLQGSNKMLKLIVDIGVEKRQIVAGIAKFYEPEQLVGKDVVVVANLEPKQIMGHESQGMVLAGGESDKIIVLNPDGPAAAGSRIS